jgi:hypothetical protein
MERPIFCGVANAMLTYHHPATVIALPCEDIVRVARVKNIAAIIPRALNPARLW